MDPTRTPPPREWLHGFVRELSHFAAARPEVQGIAGGPNWLSLRVDSHFLWLLTRPPLRLAWLDERPTAARWMQLLGRHGDNPFARQLRGAHLLEASVLRSDEEKDDGLTISLAPPLGAISLRFFPRPGSIWLSDEKGIVVAQQGRMAGTALQPTEALDVAFDSAIHVESCRHALEQLLLEQLDGRLRKQLRQRAKKETRRALAREADLRRARERLVLRSHADVLAAHLHELRGNAERVTLEGFDGEPVSIELDPTLDAAGNLKALYKSAAKAERTVAELERREPTTESTDQAMTKLDSCDGLDAMLEFAAEEELEPFPSEKPAKVKAKQPRQRLPYSRYELATGRELRVGRSAKDNDALLRQYSDGRDLWLHAQGVEGSHVILRAGSSKPTAAEILAAAQLAAQFSKAKHSKLVPVLVTERKYVRKPRKAAPGAVLAERAKTEFVEPQIPEGCRRASTED